MQNKNNSQTGIKRIISFIPSYFHDFFKYIFKNDKHNGMRRSGVLGFFVCIAFIFHVIRAMIIADISTTSFINLAIILVIFFISFKLTLLSNEHKINETSRLNEINGAIVTLMLIIATFVCSYTILNYAITTFDVTFTFSLFFYLSTLWVASYFFNKTSPHIRKKFCTKIFQIFFIFCLGYLVVDLIILEKKYGDYLIEIISKADRWDKGIILFLAISMYFSTFITSIHFYFKK